MSEAVGSGQWAVGSAADAAFQPLVKQPQRESLGVILEETHRRRPADDLCETFVAALAGKGWVTARQLREATGIDDRVLRLCAEASEGRVISGQKGYKLTAEATPGEIHHACAWLISQAKRMTDRARQIRLAQHRAPRAFEGITQKENKAPGGHCCANADAHSRLDQKPTAGATGPQAEPFAAHQFGDH